MFVPFTKILTIVFKTLLIVSWINVQLDVKLKKKIISKLYLLLKK